MKKDKQIQPYDPQPDKEHSIDSFAFEGGDAPKEDKYKEETDKAEKKATLPKEMKNGPPVDRECTDLICCLVFLAFLVGMVGVSGYGLVYGDPQKFLTMWDADGRGCGYDAESKDYPYLYFPIIDVAAAKDSSGNPAESTSALLRFGTCVKECPAAEGPVECLEAKYMINNKNFPKPCVYTILFEASAGSSGANVQAAVDVRYSTEPVGGKVCFPVLDGEDAGAANEAMKELVDKFYKETLSQLNESGVTDYVNDTLATWQVLLIGIGTSFLLGFVFLIILRFIVAPVVYGTIVLTVLCMGYSGYALFQIGQAKPAEDEYKAYYTYGAYVVWGLLAILIIFLLCNCRNIRIGIAVMKTTADFIKDTPKIYILPPLSGLLMFVWLIVWMITAFFIASVGEIGPRDDFPMLTQVKWSENTRYAILYSLFGYLWLNAFIMGCLMFVIAATCGQWYFTCTSDAGSSSILKSVHWVYRYHLGSLAMGAFLIALVQFIRIIFEYYKKQIEKANKENPAIKAILCCTSYLLDCLERFIKFITKNAYIQIALTAKAFCPAAWNGFFLVIKNAATFGTAGTIGFIFELLGVIFIAAANGLVVYVFLHYIPAFQGLTRNWMPPVFIGILEGFLIGVLFMSMFSFSSDTILQAFLLDETLNRPPHERPRWMQQFADAAAGKKEEGG